MVLLFWAHLLSSPAHATIFNFWGVVPDASGNARVAYEPPPITEGPVIKLLRDHFCTGEGQALVLPKEVVQNPSFVETRALEARLWKEEMTIYTGGQAAWNDQTIFADMPFELSSWEKYGVFRGLMESQMAGLLSANCGDKEPVPYMVFVKDN